MPYRAGERTARCRHCMAETRNTCLRCALRVCTDCEARHDDEVPHRDHIG